MEMYFARTKEKQTTEFEGKLNALLKLKGINPETVIVIKDEVIITGDDIVLSTDKLTILPVISGGRGIKI